MIPSGNNDNIWMLSEELPTGKDFHYIFAIGDADSNIYAAEWYNSALTNLGCANQLTSSQLTVLDVSNNTALNNLSCDGNQLKCLDVSKNSLLTGLDVSDNLLEILKTKNGAGIGLQVNLANNNLQCAEVDDISWAQNNWTYDSFTTFSSDCNYSGPCPNVLGVDLPSSKQKNLLRIYDVLGRETTFRFNTLLIYIYDDGSAEKVFAVE